MSPVIDGRRARGDRTREAILAHAVDLASCEGLESLSIGRLATGLGISKSGLFAHFGSKDDLQVEVIRAARDVFAARVLVPALAAPAGVGRLEALCERWLAYSKDRVFAGGCFFAQAGAEFDARPGKVRNELAAAMGDWLTVLERSAATLDGVGPDHAPQLAFELYALMEAANAMSLLRGDPSAYDRARTGIHQRLAGYRRQAER
ncbi:TetR family transcriptional regulator [Actinoplanes sp. NBRC 101535]|nr:TetR family transcriptional regulator [Actinoplanes sp. NBRC 101535]